MPGMLRLLLLAAAAYLIYRGVRSLLQPTGRLTGKPKDPLDRVGTPLVQCAECGQFIPEPEAIRASVGGQRRTFCSPECRAGDPRGKPDS